jgi:GNAT superfamily N-acetyltransferase
VFHVVRDFGEAILPTMTVEPATIEIRHYRADDRDQVIGLARELQAHERAVYDRMLPPPAIGRGYVEALLADCSKYGGGIIIAEIEGALVGYAVVETTVHEESIDEEHYTYAYVADLVVTESRRGAGVGRRLLSACEDIAVKAGARWLRISALAANEPARTLYRRFGFADHLITLEKPIGD